MSPSLASPDIPHNLTTLYAPLNKIRRRKPAEKNGCRI